MEGLFAFPYQWVLFASQIVMLGVLTLLRTGFVKRGIEPNSDGMIQLRSSRGALLVGIVLTLIGLVIGIWGSRYNALIIAGALMLALTLFLMFTGLLRIHKVRR